MRSAMREFCSTSSTLTFSSRLMATIDRAMSWTSFGAMPSEGSSRSSSLRLRHQRASDHQHLLLAAAHRAGRCVITLLEARKAREDHFDALADLGLARCE